LMAIRGRYFDLATAWKASQPNSDGPGT
jgi:hypothetical protein